MYSILLSKIEQGFPLIKESLKKHISPNSKVVIIPWSFSTETDSQGLNQYYQEKIKNKYLPPLLDLGIKLENINYLNCYTDNYQKMQNLINSSDIIILTGGNPEMLYNKIVSCNLLDILKKYHKIVIGSSAGAVLQLKDYFITAKNNYYQKFAWYKGIGLLNNPFYIDVHSCNKADYLNQFKLISLKKHKDIYAIFDNGAIIYDRQNNKISTFGMVIKINNY